MTLVFHISTSLRLGWWESRSCHRLLYAHWSCWGFASGETHCLDTHTHNDSIDSHVCVCVCVGRWCLICYTRVLPQRMNWSLLLSFREKWAVNYVAHSVTSSQRLREWMDGWMKMIQSRATVEPHCSQMPSKLVGFCPPQQHLHFPWLLVLPQPCFHKPFVFHELLHRFLPKAGGSLAR